MILSEGSEGCSVRSKKMQIVIVGFAAVFLLATAGANAQQPAKAGGGSASGGAAMMAARGQQGAEGSLVTTVRDTGFLQINADASTIFLRPEDGRLLAFDGGHRH